MRGKTIRQFLIDGTADGRWLCDLSNWTGKAYKVPRTYVNVCSDRKDLSNSGVCFLFGVNDETDMPQVYIGETENILERVKKHVAEKDFWTEFIAFISKDNNLNRAHIKYLERNLYWLAKESKRYEVLNANIPAGANISEMDRAEMDEYIDNMRLLLSVLGHRVLEPSVVKTKSKKELLFLLQDRNGVKAVGKQTSEGFAVLKGSVVAKDVMPSLSATYLRRRQQLIDEGIINKQNEFTQDWLFTSPSLAGAVVAGYSINGRTAWKNANGQSLKDIELQLNN